MRRAEDLDALLTAIGYSSEPSNDLMLVLKPLSPLVPFELAATVDEDASAARLLAEVNLHGETVEAA